MRFGLPDSAGIIPQGFAPVLSDDWAIAAYVQQWSPGDIDEEFVREAFRFGVATLRMVPVSDLIEGPSDSNIRDASREAIYAKMDPSTMPPLLVEFGEVKDGNHRYRIARDAGREEVPCYEIEYPED